MKTEEMKKVQQNFLKHTHKHALRSVTLLALMNSEN